MLLGAPALLTGCVLGRDYCGICRVMLLSRPGKHVLSQFSWPSVRVSLPVIYRYFPVSASKFLYITITVWECFIEMSLACVTRTAAVFNKGQSTVSNQKAFFVGCLEGVLFAAWVWCSLVLWLSQSCYLAEWLWWMSPVCWSLGLGQFPEVRTQALHVDCR